MSQVRCIRAAAGLAAVALLLPGLALPGAAAPPWHPGVQTEPAPAWGALSVAVSPVLVPPYAPVDVTVSSPGLDGRRVDVQVATNGRWAVVARPVLDAEGRAVVHLVRGAAGRYDVRAVYTPVADGPDVGVESRHRTFEVTATGLGDPKAYRYLSVTRGVPARWDPCRAVTYRVNASAARATSLGDLREALRRVSYETGVAFRETGVTRQVPGGRGFAYDADVVVAWTAAVRSKHLGGKRAAAGGFEPPVAGRGGRPRIRHGFVVLDTDVVAEMAAGFGAGMTEGQVLLHELGHLMGLDHVNADHQVMRPEVRSDVPAALYGAGDLTGLRRIGRAAGCV